MDINENTLVVTKRQPTFVLEGVIYGADGPFELGTIPAGSRDTLLRNEWIAPYVEPSDEPDEEAAAGDSDTSDRGTSGGSSASDAPVKKPRKPRAPKK